MNRRVAAHGFFDVLRIDVFAADDEQVLLSANNIKFPVKVETKVARAVPAIHDRLGGEVGPIVVALEHTIGFYENLADPALRKNLAGIRNDTHFVVRQQTARRYKRHCPRSSLRNWRDKVFGTKTRSIRPNAPGFSGMHFRELDDFHPDRIYADSELFQRLREVRRKLEKPATFAEAAAEIRAWSHGPPAPAATARTEPPAEPERPALPDAASGVSLLDSIVEADGPPARPPVTRRDDLRSFVESVVAPYTVPAENPELPRLRSLVDAESGARMRAILHHTTFQALEAAWRGVFHLVRAIETGSQLKLYLLDISQAELAADLSSANDLRGSRAWRMLVDETTGMGEDAWSVVAGNYSFARTAGDAKMLSRLARIMSFAGAPFLGEADPGSSSQEAAPEWERLRQLPEACWIGLAMARFLLRLPQIGRG